MASSSRIRRIQEVIEPMLEQRSVELVDIRMLVQNGRRILRLSIDKPGGVDLDDCATVSREASVLLDVHDVIPGRYTLEVSSPGLDRPLRKPSDFKRNEGRTLQVGTHGSDGVRRQLVGELISSDDREIHLRVKGEEIRISHQDIASARVQPRF
jgi:ribosome maturation factor RimP